VSESKVKEIFRAKSQELNTKIILRLMKRTCKYVLSLIEKVESGEPI
jgi:hypothetical protein